MLKRTLKKLLGIEPSKDVIVPLTFHIFIIRNFFPIMFNPRVAALELKRSGFVVLPVFSEEEVAILKRKFLDAMKSFPEYKPTTV